MGLFYRRTRSAGHGRRVTVTNRGVGMSQRLGRLSVSSRGRGSFRIAPGLSFRFRWKR
jgi:hypothetical protein